MSLTKTQRWAIGADLGLIRSLSFTHLRILTHTKAGNPDIASWPSSIFLTFPQPTPTELQNLLEFTQMTALFGMTYEVVFVAAGAGNLYYQNGVTSAMYRQFFDSVWSAIWGGMLARIYFGGDMRFGDHDPDQALVANHRDFMLSEWPYFAGKPGYQGLAIGTNLNTGDAYLWDRGADSLAWIRANLMARPPSFVGGQMYPTSHAFLIQNGFESGGRVDWRALTVDWLGHMRAAAGPIPVHADEVGLLLKSSAPISSDFTEDDQAAFLPIAYDALTRAGVAANAWEFADHDGIGEYGLLTASRRERPVTLSLPPLLKMAQRASLQPGVSYTPPEYPGLQWLLGA